jgi:peptidoglycan/LPS O-acetylase OafA/YrhL
MWSVAVECDIYVLFALVLVPVARRFGFTVMVAGALAISLLPTLLGALHHEFVDYRFAQTCPWFVGLFALGYAAANLSVDPRPAIARRFQHWPWGRIAAGCALATLVAVVLTPSDLDYDKGGNGIRWYADILLGLAIAAQFTADAQARLQDRRTNFERFFTLRPLLFLGTFSYSFYLVHIPVSDLVMSLARPDWSSTAVTGLAVCGFIAALIVGYIFYRLVERPFMTEYRRRGDAASLRSSKAIEIPDDSEASATTQPASA